MTKQASQFVGSIPEHYDRCLGPRIFYEFADHIAAKVAALNPEAVLELAAGTGIVTRRLRDAITSSCALTATDLNQPMLNCAKNKFHKGENIRFETADATQLPFGESIFDTVVCQFGVMFFPDKQRSYQQVLRVLKPGGRYVFSVWDAWEHNPFAEIAHESVAEFFPGDPPGFYKVPFGYHDADAITQSLTRAGFSAVRTELVNVTSAIPSAAEFATGLVYGNPLFMEITDRGGDPAKVCAAISAAIEDKLGDSMPLRALAIVAHKP